MAVRNIGGSGELVTTEPEGRPKPSLQDIYEKDRIAPPDHMREESMCPDPADARAQLAQGKTLKVGSYSLVTVAKFECGDERYAWLNDVIAVGTGEQSGSTQSILSTKSAEADKIDERTANQIYFSPFPPATVFHPSQPRFGPVSYDLYDKKA